MEGAQVKISFVSVRDRFRTVINVMCDCLCARVVDHLSKGELTGKVAEEDRLNADPHELVEITKPNF